MRYSEQEARKLVIEAGRRLLASGLVSRTWGNISARVSGQQFVITPSGLAYDTLQPEQLVLVNIEDCTYEGSIKPSSEKGIHAAAYRLRPDAGLIIHTHQDYASCVGISGKDLTDLNHPVLGDTVPCAAYGLPGTKKLMANVEAAMLSHPRSRAFLMRHHGALLLGQDFDRAFLLAETLEEVCRGIFENTVSVEGKDLQPASGLLNELTIAATGQHFSVESHGAVLDCAAKGRTLHPYLDDLAQIAGTTVRYAENEATAVMSAMKGRNAVLVPGIGAVCSAEDADDLPAIGAIIRKGCMAALYAEKTGTRPLGGLDRLLMRLVYRMKYSRKKAEN